MRLTGLHNAATRLRQLALRGAEACARACIAALSAFTGLAHRTSGWRRSMAWLRQRLQGHNVGATLAAVAGMLDR